MREVAGDVGTEWEWNVGGAEVDDIFGVDDVVDDDEGRLLARN